jgi:hypothetical protein
MTACRWGFEEGAVVVRSPPGQGFNSPFGCEEACLEFLLPTQNSEAPFKQFDCLFIDCEGHEENIICQLDFDRVKPRLIVFEHTHQGERNKVIEARLTEQGFTFVHLTHDTIASRIL